MSLCQSLFPFSPLGAEFGEPHLLLCGYLLLSTHTQGLLSGPYDAGDQTQVSLMQSPSPLHCLLQTLFIYVLVVDLGLDYDLPGETIFSLKMLHSRRHGKRWGSGKEE